MMRLLGILLGSVIAIAALIVIVGVPEVTPEAANEAAVPAPEAVILPPERPLPTARADATVQTVDSAAPAAAEQDAAVPPAVMDAAEPPAQPAIAAISEPDPGDLRWHAFWSPFRSQIAANGFVTQLQRVTGLDYRVVNVKPGVYEVAFAYRDDDEIAASLSQISTATGLDVPQT